MVFNYNMHKAMWMWLSKNPEKKKCDWPYFKHINDAEYRKMEKHFFCYACRAANVTSDTPMDVCASICPIDWETDNGHCTSKGSIYNKYSILIYNRQYEEASEIAEMIANAPIRNIKGLIVK